MINDENYQTCFYQSDKLKAMISLGAVWDEESQQAQIVYYLTVNDLENHEIQSRHFIELNNAIETLNRLFSQWQLIDLVGDAKKKSEGGCSSCVAH